ncbi:hypothetical protein HDA32_001853 [Spinactinospora alkalitolerans]|uniref:Uncharacterized protein n=1 Tax=Spinactinospora alkalitolerans TaxID=687207 RepID=A0A852TV94_9ACTN|nr:hypothetical protein [Spinactinospora alkalitolerans]NYE46733.1 hypothetical protein [Spinactinospora alkalitolerans]
MSEGEEKKKRIDLSMSQVVGGGVATLTAATAASYLGVYGTIIGTAVMSVISTAGTAVAQHYLQRSGDRARGLAERRAQVAVTRGRSDSATGELRAAGPGTAADADTLLAAATETEAPSQRWRRDGDVETTQLFPAVGETSGFGADETVAIDAESRPEHRGKLPDGVRGDDTRALPSAGGAERPEAERDGAGRDSTWWRRWRALVIPAVAVFLLVMAVITAFELFSGRALSDTLRGEDSGSAPSLLGGYSGSGADASADVPTTGPDTGGQEETTGEQPTTGPSQVPGAEDGADGEGEGTGEPTEPAATPEPGEEGQQTEAPADPEGGADDGTSDGGDSGSDPGGSQQAPGDAPPADGSRQVQPEP